MIKAGLDDISCLNIRKCHVHQFLKYLNSPIFPFNQSLQSPRCVKTYFCFSTRAKMKIVEVSDLASVASNYDDIAFSESKKPNKFGKLFYLNEKIMLVIRKPITDYGLWSPSDKDEANLIITLPAELKREIDAIIQAVSKQDQNLQFKELAVGEKLYIKIRKECGKVALNEELQIVVKVYAFFHQTTTMKSFLQLEVSEIHSRRISLLNGPTKQVLHYEPSYMF